jgi:hypothetical protein
VDLVGKHGRVRTIPMPTWVKVAIDTWTLPCGITDSHVLRRVSRGDVAHDEGMSEKVVWQLLQGYAATAGALGGLIMLVSPGHGEESATFGAETGADTLAQAFRARSRCRCVQP